MKNIYSNKIYQQRDPSLPCSLVRKVGVILLVGLWGIALPQGVLSQASLSETCSVESDDNCVNWSIGQVMATGVGFPASWADTAAKKQLSAERAARLNAAQSLLELIEGLNLNAKAQLQSSLKADTVSTSLRSRLKNIKPVRGPEYSKDGSVRVRLATNVYGILPDKLLQAEAPSNRASSTVGGKLPTYSGLIVDARGLKAAPALSPRLLAPDGQPAYTAGYVDRKYLLSQGAVGYAKSLKAAKNNARVGSNPLVIKPESVSGLRQTDFVLSRSDAELLSRLHRRQDFLSQSRVLIVLGNGKK